MPLWNEQHFETLSIDDVLQQTLHIIEKGAWQQIQAINKYAFEGLNATGKSLDALEKTEQELKAKSGQEPKDEKQQLPFYFQEILSDAITRERKQQYRHATVSVSEKQQLLAALTEIVENQLKYWGIQKTNSDTDVVVHPIVKIRNQEIERRQRELIELKTLIEKIAQDKNFDIFHISQKIHQFVYPSSTSFESRLDLSLTKALKQELDKLDQLAKTKATRSTSIVPLNVNTLEELRIAAHQKLQQEVLRLNQYLQQRFDECSTEEQVKIQKFYLKILPTLIKAKSYQIRTSERTAKVLKLSRLENLWLESSLAWIRQAILPSDSPLYELLELTDLLCTDKLMNLRYQLRLNLESVDDLKQNIARISQQAIANSELMSASSPTKTPVKKDKLINWSDGEQQPSIDFSTPSTSAVFSMPSDFTLRFEETRPSLGALVTATRLKEKLQNRHVKSDPKHTLSRQLSQVRRGIFARHDSPTMRENFHKQAQKIEDAHTTRDNSIAHVIEQKLAFLRTELDNLISKRLKIVTTLEGYQFLLEKFGVVHELLNGMLKFESQLDLKPNQQAEREEESSLGSQNVFSSCGMR